MPSSVKTHIKKGDTVYVLRGRDYEHRLEGREEELAHLDAQGRRAEVLKSPGRRGKVIGVLPDKGRVIVDGVNIITKHAKPRGMTTRAAQVQSGRTQQPGAIALANVMLVCPRCDRPTKVMRREVSGKRIRVCRRCNEYIDEV